MSVGNDGHGRAQAARERVGYTWAGALRHPTRDRRPASGSRPAFRSACPAPACRKARTSGRRRRGRAARVACGAERRVRGPARPATPTPSSPGARSPNRSGCASRSTVPIGTLLHRHQQVPSRAAPHPASGVLPSPAGRPARRQAWREHARKLVGLHGMKDNRSRGGRVNAVSRGLRPCATPNGFPDQPVDICRFTM